MIVRDHPIGGQIPGRPAIRPTNPRDHQDAQAAAILDAAYRADASRSPDRAWRALAALADAGYHFSPVGQEVGR